MSHPAPPYPADTKAKGWRFELDYEQVEQSDTWDLANAEVRPWLLMMWFAAWRQAPCGSLPADEEVLPAKFGMPVELWARHRRIMLRGWKEASDGRLYHETLTERVLEMLGRRRSDADRQATRRAKKPAKTQPGPPPAPAPTQPEITDVSRVTPTELHRESSTDHRPPNTEYRALARTEDAPRAGTHEAPPPPDPPPPPPPPDSPTATTAVAPGVAGMLCRRLKAMGIGNVNPGNLRLTTLLAAGATPEEFIAGAAKSMHAKDPFAYLLGIVEGERTRAADVAQRVHRGPMPAAPPGNSFAERRDRQLAVAAVLTGVAPPAAAPAPTQLAEVIDGQTRLLS